MKLNASTLNSMLRLELRSAPTLRWRLNTFVTRTSNCTLAGPRPVFLVTPGGRVMGSPKGSDPVMTLKGGPLGAEKIDPARRHHYAAAWSNQKPQPRPGRLSIKYD